MEGVQFASSILTRAVKLDTAKSHTESLVCYQEGIQILMNVLNKSSLDATTKEKVKAKVKEYMERAEIVKEKIRIAKENGDFREQMRIDEGAIGYSYEKVFGRFLDPEVHRIEMDDPYIRTPHQCDNFLRFVELCLRECPNLGVIFLKTKQDESNHSDQKQRLDTIIRSVNSFTNKKVKVQIHYAEELHDREIRLDTGWIIKIGRGLDYFKPVDRYAVGWNEYSFRPCKATIIDVFHKNDLNKCPSIKKEKE